MTYNPGIPQPNDKFPKSQVDILANFGQANTAFGIDHVNFATALNQGKHNKVTFLTVGPPGSLAGEFVVYQKIAGGLPNLFFQRNNLAPEIRLTGPDPVAASPGQTFLPGGLVMRWGVSVGIPAAGGAVNFNIAFTTTCYALQLTGRHGSAAHYCSFTNLTNVGFFAYPSVNNLQVHWLAIGD